ncbi:hypothetical protein BDN72DRAFT_849180 [Pluteus cervinus]|uniref:Uncharacterized protein n=1 Tax=Pluteus cervinus TaxID=181527 RepID=A0ACD3A7X8_9AGAR|nr:hypothetical protein BDN72DRAFT_849180 [Pluteus cervinus]
MDPSPRLPPELEYAIFVLAYQDDHREAKNLALVARRVFNCSPMASLFQSDSTNQSTKSMGTTPVTS